MQKTFNISHVRAMNQRTILEAIFRNGSISKAELARMLHLSKPAMTDNVDTLLELGVVRESGEGKSGPGGGRRPTMLALNEQFRYIVAIDFFYTVSHFILGDLRGEVIRKISVNQTPSQNFAAWQDMAVNTVGELLSSQVIAPEDLAAIGVSSPGVVSRDRKTIQASAMAGDFDAGAFVSRLSHDFPCPVYVKNSANVYAVAEAEYGAGRGYENILYLSCGEGLGAGILFGGKLYEGNGMAAGEIGNFVTPDTMEMPDRLEERIGVESFMNLVRDNAPAELLARLELSRPNRDLFEQVVRLWQEGELFLRGGVDRLGRQLGCIVADMVMLLNCDLVILGGEYLAFSDQLVPMLQHTVNQRCYIPAKVVPSQRGKEGRGLGMLALCREFYFDIICGIE